MNDTNRLLEMKTLEMEGIVKKIASLKLISEEGETNSEGCDFNNIIFAFNNLSGTDLLRFFCSIYVQLFDADYIYIAEFDAQHKSIQIKSGIENGKPVSSIELKVQNTPAENIINKEFFCYKTDVRNAFPKDKILKRFNIDSVAGFPLLKYNEIIGVIYLLKKQAIEKPEQIKSYFQLFATRITNELYVQRKEKYLESSEKKYKKIFDLANDTIFLVKGKHFAECNTKSLEMFGCSDKDEIIGKTVSDFSPVTQPDGSDSAEKAQMYINEVKKGIPQRFYWKHCRKDGTLFDAEVSLNPLRIDNGVHFQGIVRDISSQMKDKRSLLESEELFKILFEHAPDSMYLNDLSGKLIYGNKAAEELMGVPRESMIGENFFDSILDPEDKTKALQNLEINLQGLRSGPNEYRINTAGGQKIVEISGFPVQVNNEMIALGIARDITERKRIEKELKEQNSVIRSIVETSKDWIWATGLNGFNTFSNEAVFSVLGYSIDEIQDKPITSFIHEEDFHIVNKKFIASLEEQKGWQNLVIKWKHKDGTIRYLESNSVPIYNEVGEFTGFRGVDRDITERINFEKELIRAKEVAEENEQRLLETQRVAKIGNYSFDLKTKIYKISPELEKIFGYDHPQDPGFDTWIQHVHPEDREAMIRYMEVDVFTDHNPSHNDYRIISGKTGETVWVHSQGMLRFDADNNPVELYGTVQDITLLKEAELRLLEYNLLLEKTQEEILLKNRISNSLILSKEEEFYKSILDIILEALKCSYGFFGYIDYDKHETLVCPSLMYGISGKTNSPGKYVEFPKESWSGIWGESLIQKKSIYKNSGLEVPFGHAKLNNALAVPIVYNNQLIGQIVVANKEDEFQQSHLQVLEDICNYISPLLFSKLKEEKHKKELVEARKKSKESELKYRNLAENTLDFIYTLDLECRHTMVNESVQQALNLSFDEIIGKNHIELGFPEDVANKWKQMHHEVISTGKNLTVETTIPTKDGTIRHYEVILTPIFDDQNKVTGIRGINRDITAKKEHQAELSKAIEMTEESEAKFKRAFENSGVGMCLVGLDGRFMKVNKAITTILGYSEYELTQLTFQEITHPDDLSLDLGLLDETIRGERDNYFLVKRYFDKTGKIVFANLNVSIIRNRQSKPLFFVSQIENITKQKEYEKALIAAKEKAEESDRLKTAFLLNVSHEIRTPMNGILGFIELLNIPDLSDQERLSYVEIINKSGERLMNTINDIVEISKIEIGDIQLRYEEIDMVELMQYYYNFFKAQATEIGLKFEIKEQITGKAAHIISDKHKLDGILMNLLRNAIKFTTSGKIEIGNYIEEGKLYIYVSDTGIGIPEDKQETIFDRFVQAEIGMSRGYEGSGIGLSIVKAYVEVLKGSLELKSQPGKGTTFRFCIPYEPAYAIPARPEKTDSDKLIQKKLTLLVTEDDKVNYQLLEKILGGDYNILFAENGSDAVNIFSNHPEISLILMDVKMPGEYDGLEATRRIRQINKDVPIIAQTAFAMDHDKTRAIGAGCNDYISKPYNTVKLKSLIKKYLP